MPSTATRASQRKIRASVARLHGDASYVSTQIWPNINRLTSQTEVGTVLFTAILVVALYEVMNKHSKKVATSNETAAAASDPSASMTMPTVGKLRALLSLKLSR